MATPSPPAPATPMTMSVADFTQNGILFPHLSAHQKPAPTVVTAAHRIQGTVTFSEKKFNAATATANNNPSKVRARL